MKPALETIFVEAKSQYSLKVGNRWIGVKRPLTLEDFNKGHTYTVLTEPWEKNGKSGVNVVQVVDAAPSSPPLPSVPVVPQATVTASTISIPARTTETVPTEDKRLTKQGAEYIKAGFGKPMTDYEIELDTRISYAGLLQAAVQSPALAVLPVKSHLDIAAAAIDIADALSKAIDKKLAENV